MRQFTLPVLLLSGALLSDPVFAHGGQYRGPSAVGPGTSGAGASATSGAGGGGSNPSSGPSGTGADPGPTAPNSAPTPAGGGTTTGSTTRGAPIDDDLTRWEFWWEFGKDSATSGRK